ncbi:putative LRR receptor-like serine/threonine-protein kinase [Gossypium australe]|uniref:Putative LRR receptor-like serine/threonine-protein kinase n=1 Tax=Gossypium australe TaxID=47621 RepID=A0A5B6W164_9ROSI|nr:putative LRR receptor-like serine/threonine-protein kinase [Gossypium australe]
MLYSMISCLCLLNGRANLKKGHVLDFQKLTLLYVTTKIIGKSETNTKNQDKNRTVKQGMENIFATYNFTLNINPSLTMMKMLLHIARRSQHILQRVILKRPKPIKQIEIIKKPIIKIGFFLRQLIFIFVFNFVHCHHSFQLLILLRRHSRHMPFEQ